MPARPTPVQTAESLAREIGRPAAVAWTHVLAVLEHARTLGLTELPALEGPDDTRTAVDVLAGAHPALAAFADPDVTRLGDRAPTAKAWSAAVDLWRSAPPMDGGIGLDAGFRLGDAYQEVSEEARKGRALCQTPPWVADLLLKLALEPALDTTHEGVGPDTARMIDPSCGSGHILLRALDSIRWHAPRGRAPKPYVSTERRLERALEAVHGVDLDPYAALLARYRMLAYAAGALRVPLGKVPTSWPVQVAAADSLLATDEPLLERGRYDAVVGNPPYITVADAGLRERIRAAYPQVARGKFSLALPFSELMFALAVPGRGRIAQLTTNAWMKREYGKAFTEEFLPQFHIEWIIDTSGCYIPGHGTPTMILVTRACPPQGDTVRAILGKQGEPHVPDDPALGLVWRAIEQAVHRRLDHDRFQRGMEAYHQA
ncbi:MAG: DNA methylase [Streptomycetaceae bacterium]|nr:DNA methylase [Streptomycetaceae bacterium]